MKCIIDHSPLSSNLKNVNPDRSLILFSNYTHMPRMHYMNTDSKKVYIDRSLILFQIERTRHQCIFPRRTSIFFALSCQRTALIMPRKIHLRILRYKCLSTCKVSIKFHIVIYMIKIIFIKNWNWQCTARNTFCIAFILHNFNPSTRKASRQCFKISDVFWYLYKWIFNLDLRPQRVSSSCGLPLVYPASISILPLVPLCTLSSSHYLRRRH